MLLVPNAALRFSPPVAADASQQGSYISRLVPRPPQTKRTQAKSTTMAPQVWTLKDGQAVAAALEVGASNGRQTEITGGELKAGMAVITDYQETIK